MYKETPADPDLIRYVGSKKANHDYHHGQLRPAVGTHNIQVVRANRSNPEAAEGFGWTYNHAPMLAFWNNRFYLEYLSTPVNEHEPPGHTLLSTSLDGRNWEKPIVAFARYLVPDGIYQGPAEYPLPSKSYAVMHQRMGFYVAPNDRMLLLGFYGICPTPDIWPNDGRGIGRVAREIYPNGKLGPVYFVRLNTHAGWNEANVRFPLYTESKDIEFVAACEALLEDRLMTLQWWEEDRSEDGFYAVSGHKSFTYYHLPDGRVAGLWKWSKAALSENEGQTWSEICDVPSLVMAGAKIWGEKTSDGRYALVYNPTLDNKLRWPLAVATGDGGLCFDEMLLVNGEVPPRRYIGYLKDLGQNYIRGIVEGNGSPPDGALWLTYSMNKEDIWISRVPVPIRSRETEPLNESFDGLEETDWLAGWNIYCPKWATLTIEQSPGKNDRSLRFYDRDPYDYAKAERVFPESKSVTLQFKVLAEQNDRGELHVELVDEKSVGPVRIMFAADGYVQAKNAGPFRRLIPYEAGTWYEFTVHADVVSRRFQLTINGQLVVEDGFFIEVVESLERIVFRTGRRRWEPNTDTVITELGDLPEADDPTPPLGFYLNYLRTTDHVIKS